MAISYCIYLLFCMIVARPFGGIPLCTVVLASGYPLIRSSCRSKPTLCDALTYIILTDVEKLNDISTSNQLTFFVRYTTKNATLDEPLVRLKERRPDQALKTTDGTTKTTIILSLPMSTFTMVDINCNGE